MIMTHLLGRFSNVYFPKEYQSFAATLTRKVLHSDEKGESAAEKVFGQLCAVDMHTKHAGAEYYKISKRQAVAKKALIIFCSIFGEPVEWPSEEEIRKGKADSLARLNLFSRQGKDKGEGDDDEDEESGEEVAEEDGENGEEGNGQD